MKVIKNICLIITITMIIVVLNFVSMPFFSFAKDIDSTSYNSYFPLQLGNKWIFQLNEPEPYNTYFTLAIDDTTQYDNRVYWKFSPMLFGGNEYYRIDSLGNFLQINNDKPILNFNMQVGDSIQIWYSSEYSDSGYTYCVSRDSVTTFIGSQGEEIEFFVNWSLQIVDEADVIILQQGVGPIGYSFTEHDLPMILRGAVLNGIVYGDTTTTSVSYSKIEIASHFHLSQNYPNPFNPTTRITYYLPNSSYVTLTIYDLLGRAIKTLVSEFQTAGSRSVNFNGGNISSGVYFYQLKAGNGFVKTRKMILMR